MEAYKFVDFLEASCQTIWQVLPLGPTGFGDSPYQCFSAFAGNPLLVSPQALAHEGLLSELDYADLPENAPDRVNFGAAIKFKYALLELAFQRFNNARSELHSDFVGFCARYASWLQDYSLFRALKDEHGGSPWY